MQLTLNPPIALINHLVAGLLAGAALGALAGKVTHFIRYSLSAAQATEPRQGSTPTLVLGVATIFFAALMFIAAYFATIAIANLQPPL